MSFTSGNDTNILQATDSAIVGAGYGDDIYILSEATLSANQKIKISDAEGVNTLQLVDGLTIVNSQVANDAVLLTLSNGAEITVLGASAFSFDLGGNAVQGTTGTVQDFATFAEQTLGTTLPAAGASPVQGGSITIGSIAGTPGDTFTLKEAVVTRDVLNEMDVEPTIETVTYWGFSNLDDLQGEAFPDSNELNAIPLTELVSYIESLAGLDFVQLGLINVANGEDDGLDSGDASNGEGATQLFTTEDLTGLSITNDFNLEPDANGNVEANITFEFSDGSIHEAEVEIAAQLFEYLNDLLFYGDETSRLFTKTFEVWPQVPALDENGEPMYDVDGNLITRDLEMICEADQEEVFVPITLTTEENNGGTVETGFATEDDDTLVAGRLDLLHQAYIDGGDGYDTLEIDAKGHFAQPLQLLNIEHVSITNLPNIYDYEDLDPENLDDFNYGRDNDDTYFWSNPANVDQNSIIDLNRATSLDKVTITESDYDGLTNLDVSGSLTVAGIRNGADLNLQGGFSQDLNLFYTEGNTGDGLNITLNNVDFNEGHFNIAHNANTFNIVSEGGDNYLNTINGLYSATLSTINVSGDAFLQIADVAAIYNNTNQRLATFDASQNSGGVNIGFTNGEQARINFTGSQADDVLNVDAHTDEITINNASGANRYNLTASELIDITDATGNNEYLLNLDDGVASVTAQGEEGNNDLKLNVADIAEVITLNLDSDRNTAEIDGDSEELNVTTPGDRNAVEVTGDVEVVDAQMTGERNSIEIEGDTEEVTVVLGDHGVAELNYDNETVDITLEGGDGYVFIGWAEDLTISAVDGGNTFDVYGDVLSITAGGYDNVAYVGGSEGRDEDLVFDNGSLLDVDMNGTLYLGYEDDDSEIGVTALEGSTITAENLDIIVVNNSNLTQAALTGINSVELQDTLRMTVDQFLAIGPEAFSAYQEEFGSKESLELVVNSDTDLTDVDLSSLRLFANDDEDSFAEAGVELSFYIAKGAELTLTAQQLHENVAEEGIKVDEEDVINGNLGSVVITQAGLEFDPWGDGEDGYGEGGTLSSEYVEAVNVTIVRDGDYERPEVEDPSDVYPIVVTSADQIIDGLETQARTIEITGDGNLIFTDTLDAENLEVLDFSELNGNLNGLTIENFDSDLIEEVKGNNSDTRINVELEGDVASDVNLPDGQGLVSSGVETYVVTELNGEDRVFWTCETTEDLETLGLQGNYGSTITFGNVDHGVNFLMEAVYDKANGSAVVGELVGEFARPGATVVVDVIDAEGRLADGESIMIEGLSFDNAADITVNVTGGDAVIESIEVLTDDVSAESLTLTSVDDLTLTLTGDELDGLTDLNADGVDGDMILFVDGEADLSELTTLDGIDQVLLDDDANLSLSIEQATAIGADNFIYVGPDADASNATLTLTDLNDQVFSLADYADGIIVDVQISDDETVTLNPLTDLTGFGGVIVGEDTTLTLSGDQLVQLLTSFNAAQLEELVLAGGKVIDGDGRVVVTDFTQDHVDALRDWAAEENFDGDLDFSLVIADTLERVTLQVDGDLELSGYEDADNNFREIDIEGLAGILSFEMNGSQLTLVTDDQANGLLVNDANVKFTFVDDATFIDMAGYTNIVEVEVYALLINRNDNIENLFLNLESSIQDLENVIRVVDTPVGLTLDRAVIVDAGVTTEGDMQFITSDDADSLDNVANVWINLAGDSTIDGDIVLHENVAAEGTFDTLTIVSYGDDANTITGSIVADQNHAPVNVPGVEIITDNNLLNLVIDADADLVIEGDIVFQSLDDEAVATLILTGNGNVTLAGLDTDDNDVDGLTIDMEGLGGTLTLIDSDDNNGDVDYDWTELDDLTIIGNSDANPIVLGENVVLHLTAEQANGLVIVPAAGADVETITVNITDLNNDVTYDFTGINTDIAGQITLNPYPVIDGGADGRVQLEAGTDLGDFAVHLFDDQLIGFMTPEQADGVEVSTEDADGHNNGNIAWLFDELTSAIDASGYSSAIERLFIHDNLVIGDPAVEQFWSGLSPNIELINIRYTGDLNFGVVDLDRTFEVSGFANLTSGLALLEGEDARYYENVTIKLGGGADVASLTLNNFVAAALADDDQVFDTLTIESGSFDVDAEFDPITNVLAPDNWDPEAGLGVPTDNTIGDIASGVNLRLQQVVLATVADIDADGAAADNDPALDLNVGTITFDGDTVDGDPVGATLILKGAEDITVESLEAGENINSIVQDVSEFTGTLTITGGSPAIFGDGLEKIVIEGDNAETVINIGLDENDAFPGIDSDGLTEFNAGTFQGELNLQLSDVNGDEFTFTAGSGKSIVTLDGDMELAKDGDWKFDFSDSDSDSELIITNEVTLGDGDLTIIGDGAGDTTVRIEGNVNLSAFEGLVITDNVNLEIAEGATLTATQAQLEMFAAISNEEGQDGDGMLVIVPNAGDNTITGFSDVWNYNLDPSIGNADLTFDWEGAPWGATLNRIGTDHVVTIDIEGASNPDGTWSGFQATDVLYLNDIWVNMSEVNDGANFGGIGTIDDNLYSDVNMTEAQHTALATAVAGAGDITAEDLWIHFADVVDGVTGIEDVDRYFLFDDESNTFTVAATDQFVDAGGQGDTLNANTGADTFYLDGGEDTVVYTAAAQTYVVDDLGKTPAPTVIAGSPDQAQITVLTFVENQVGDQGVAANWEYSLEIEGRTVTYTVQVGDTLNDVINGLFDAVNTDAGLAAAGITPTGFSFGDRTLTIQGAEGAGNDFTVDVTVDDDGGNGQSVDDFIVDAASNGVDSGTDTQDAADETGGTIAITISDDNAALVNALNLKIDTDRIDDYTNIDFDQATDGDSLAVELADNGSIASAVYDNDTGVLTLTAAAGSSINIADGFTAPLVALDFDEIEGFDAEGTGTGEDLLNLKGLSLTADNFVGDINLIDTGITTTDLYEAAQEAAGLIDKGDFGYFALDGDTYVFADIGANDDQANSDDFLVELNGVTPVLTTDDFILA